MKVYFVGIHNKPGLKPLDSKSMTGKVIDQIIAELPFDCIKTNLCEDDYLPTDKAEIMADSMIWYNKYLPKETDIIVLLGRWVQENFLYSASKMIHLTHPAGIYGTRNKKEYIEKAINKINP